MYYDYARRYSPVMLNRQRVTSRMYRDTAEGGSVKQALVWGVAAGLALVLTSCFALGLMLKKDQAELSLQQANYRQLESKGQELLVKRDGLASRQRIEQAVKKNGLTSPDGDQVIKL